jgi:hypothetical protein
VVTDTKTLSSSPSTDTFCTLGTSDGAIKRIMPAYFVSARNLERHNPEQSVLDSSSDKDFFLCVENYLRHMIVWRRTKDDNIYSNKTVLPG